MLTTIGRRIRRLPLHRLEVFLASLVLAWVGFRLFRLCEEYWYKTTDDAFVTLRYSRNLVEGHGITWNVGDEVPVEGYSNFSYVLLGAAALALHLDPIQAFKWMGDLSLVPTCLLLYVLARRWVRPLAATLPAIILLSFGGVMMWAGSALETTFYQLLVVASVTTFVLGQDAPLPARARLHGVSAVVALLAALTRPEGPIVFVTCGATLGLATGISWVRAHLREDREAEEAVLRGTRVTLVVFFAGFVLPYSVYFLWRLVHFQRLLPNTVYCKAAYTGDPLVMHKEFWGAAMLFVLVGLVQDPRKLGARALPLFLFPALNAAILYRADPIVGYGYRHFVPLLALVSVGAALGAMNLARLATLPSAWVSRLVLHLRGRIDPPGAPESRGRVLLDVVVVAGALAWLAPPLPAMWNPTKPPNKRLLGRIDPYIYRQDAREELGRYLDRTLTDQQTYLVGDVGLIGYRSHANVIDAFCLNSREYTMPPVSFDPRRFVDWVYDRAPDVLIVESTDARRLAPRTGEGPFYRLLVDDPRFKTGYQPSGAKVFGASQDEFQYWLFERRPAQ
jgi:hypothetical protein